MFNPSDIYILIVDDTPKNIQLLGTILKDKGYQILFASNGIHALKILEKKLPDLILLDIMMPDLDGYETCKRIKEDPVKAEIPIIFISAKNETEDLVKGFEVGAVDYVTKPFQSAELLSRVRTHVELKKSRELILEKNKESAELLHVLSHDLLNSFWGIKGFCEIAESKDDLWRNRELIIKSASNGLNLIDLIKQLRYVEEKGNDIPLSSISLSRLVFESVHMLSSRIKDKKIEIISDVEKDIHVLVEETSFLNSVINNLLTNSIKFSLPGGRIEIFSRDSGSNNITLTIKDYGIGMPPSILNNIFNVNKVTTRTGTGGEKGTGFGMPIVKKFLHIYGGDIHIHSVEKSEETAIHGTTTILTLRKG